MKAATLLLVCPTVALSWLLMQAVHEFGHVLHAWLSGGVVNAVFLDPRSFSRTDVAPNPHPQFVAWGGAIWGSLIPLLILGLCRMLSWTRAHLAAFWAGFCLIANGAYLAWGSTVRAGDAGDLLRFGAPQWSLMLFGIPASAFGLWLWNGLGKRFGIGIREGADRIPSDRNAIFGLSIAVLVIMILELCFTAR